MTTVTKFLVAFFLIFLVDAPFIYFIGGKYDQHWPHKLEFSARIVLAFLAVYISLAIGILYVALKTASPIMSSFLIGLTAYTTYSFTVYGIYNEWPLWLASLESLWGGILLAIVTFILQYIIPKAV